MALSLLDPGDLRAQAVDSLRLPPSASDSDVVAAAVRRAAGSLCPCPPRTLADAVASSLRGLVDTYDPLARPADVVDRLLVIGDLLELVAEDEPGGPRRRTIYAAPPTFCSLGPSHLVVVGTTPEQPSPLPLSVEAAVSTVDLVRHVADPDGGHADALRASGFTELPESLWLWAPEPEPSDRHVERYHRALDDADEVTSDPHVEVVDPDRPVDRYRSRWVPLAASHTGRYVARRPRRYGADAWSFVDAEVGEVVRLLDLPHLSKATPPDVRPYCRACDQAWQLQAAIDAERASPQPIRVHADSEGATVVDLFAPPPSWLDRRWSVVGRRHPRSPGALFSWVFPTQSAAHEVEFAARRLWLSPTSPDA